MMNDLLHLGSDSDNFKSIRKLIVYKKSLLISERKAPGEGFEPLGYR